MSTLETTTKQKLVWRLGVLAERLRLRGYHDLADDLEACLALLRQEDS